MNFTKSHTYTRWFIIIASLIITSLILWNVSLFFDQLKEAENSKMRIYAAAQRSLQDSNDVSPSPKDREARVLSNILSFLWLEIISNNNTIPLLKHNLESDTYTPTNIKNSAVLTQEELKELALEFETLNAPIPITSDGVTYDVLYYGNSPVISQLKYFPIALLLIVVLFIALIYFYYKTSKASAQNLLWAGMAKETAHQIGTPLSSLVGWTELLKTESVNPEYIAEITKDIDRLRTITDRFSKIGSKPELASLDIISETINTYDYIAARSSKFITFKKEIPQGELPVLLNKQLFGWTIENIVKNGIDAMKGKGILTLHITRDTRFVKITISDTGKGIPKSKWHTIFEPGFTTKKRGWGLGLSLANRIIEEYHQGTIKVLKSELNKGSSIQIALKINE